MVLKMLKLCSIYLFYTEKRLRLPVVLYIHRSNCHGAVAKGPDLETKGSKLETSNLVFVRNLVLVRKDIRI